MSGYAMEWAAERAAGAKLSPAARWVFVALARNANTKTGRAWPTVDWLCELSGLSPATVYRALGEVRAAELVPSEGRHRHSTVWLFPSVASRGESQNGHVDSHSETQTLSPREANPLTVSHHKEKKREKKIPPTPHGSNGGAPPWTAPPPPTPPPGMDRRARFVSGAGWIQPIR